MLSQTDRPPLQSPIRPLSVLVFSLLLIYPCTASDDISSPVIGLLGIDKTKGGVILNCESKGWYPEPELLWLDSEEHVLSAGPTETVRGPDGLYTVSSRLTVEKRDINSFTCRVQQKNIKQTRETDIYIPDDFFAIQFSSFAVTVGLAVSLFVCILVILVLVWRQNRIKTKRNPRDGVDKGEKIKCGKSNKTKDRVDAEDERQRAQLMTDGTMEMKSCQQTREEAESRVKTLKEELQTKKNKVEIKQAELQTLREEKQEIETKLQNLKEEQENKNKELETIRAQPYSFWGRNKEEQKKKEVEQEVETLEKKLETQETKFNTKIKEFEHKQAEVQKLQDEIQMMETNLKTLMEDMESNYKELEGNQDDRKFLQKKKQKRHKAQREVENDDSVGVKEQ